MEIGVATEDMEKYLLLKKNVEAHEKKLTRAKKVERGIKKAKYDLKQARKGLTNFTKKNCELVYSNT